MEDRDFRMPPWQGGIKGGFLRLPSWGLQESGGGGFVFFFLLFHAKRILESQDLTKNKFIQEIFYILI